MVRRGAILLAAVLWGLLAGAVGAQERLLSTEEAEALLRAAEAAYDLGVERRAADPDEATASFRLAAQRFGQLVAGGIVNGPLLYNLGNAQLQAGEVGEAIAAYRRADRLGGVGARLDANLAEARRRVRTPDEPDDALRALRLGAEGLVERLAGRAGFTAFLVAWSAAWLAVAARLLAPDRVPRAAALALLALAALFGAPTALVRLGLGPPPAAVLVRDGVVLRTGDGNSYDPVFEQPLGEGVEVRVREVRGEWRLVELPSGRSGWTRAEAIRTVDG